MTAATRDTRAALVESARAMLTDAFDEATGIAMAIEEAGAYLRCGPNEEGEVLAALGALADFDARAKALHAAVGAARTLLLRARDGGGR